jgi:hypothetical protein
MVEFEWITEERESPVGSYTSHTLRFTDSMNPTIGARLYISELTLAMFPDPQLLSTEQDVAAFRDIVNQTLLAYMDIRDHQQSGISVQVAIEKLHAQYRAYRAEEN